MAAHSTVQQQSAKQCHSERSCEHYGGSVTSNAVCTQTAHANAGGQQCTEQPAVYRPSDKHFSRGAVSVR